nr:PREDICTED: uncharacterized protein LOC107397985 [Tribolium castaneum]|eukprot:XP_015835891.1 PREDICTED: uncharacterized protein LOC107397985 [Tribolium castaneum]
MNECESRINSIQCVHSGIQDFNKSGVLLSMTSHLTHQPRGNTAHTSKLQPPTLRISALCSSSNFSVESVACVIPETVFLPLKSAPPLLKVSLDEVDTWWLMRFQCPCFFYSPKVETQIVLYIRAVLHASLCL